MVTDGAGSDMRYTFLALVSEFILQARGGPSAAGSYDDTGDCRQVATKLTKDILAWFYEYVANTAAYIN